MIVKSMICNSEKNYYELTIPGRGAEITSNLTVRVIGSSIEVCDISQVKLVSSSSNCRVIFEAVT